jgi:hypothetical protein
MKAIGYAARSAEAPPAIIDMTLLRPPRNRIGREKQPRAMMWFKLA